MKKNGESERKDIDIEPDIKVSDDGRSVVACIETWFDVDRKFGTRTAGDDSAWVNMYAEFDPFADTLGITCIVSREDSSQDFRYTPTPEESRLVKEMITEKIQNVYGQSPQEFCLGIENNDIKMGGQS